jgi:hypothetical protein
MTITDPKAICWKKVKTMQVVGHVCDKCEAELGEYFTKGLGYAVEMKKMRDAETGKANLIISEESLAAAKEALKKSTKDT